MMRDVKEIHLNHDEQKRTYVRMSVLPFLPIYRQRSGKAGELVRSSDIFQHDHGSYVLVFR
jgi:hypothetical protein